MTPDALLLGLVWYVVFLFSTTCHEAAHAWAAKLGGDLTAFHGGQVTLDPLPHIRREPMGMVLMPILSYFYGGWMMGWASAPYDPFWARRNPRRAAWMSLAGPGANFTLAILAAILINIGILAGFFVVPDGLSFTHVVAPTASGVSDGAATFLSVLFSLNLLLGTFNLIPLPPLDGFGALGLIAGEEGARKLQDFGVTLRGFGMIGLMLAWYMFDYVFDPVYAVAIRLLYLGHGLGV